MASPLPLPVGLVPMVGVGGGGGWVRIGGGWRVSSIEGGWGGGACGVDSEEVPMPDIKFCQYLSSMTKCAHVLCALVFPTPGMIRRRLWTMDFLFV